MKIVMLATAAITILTFGTTPTLAKDKVKVKGSKGPALVVHTHRGEPEIKSAVVVKKTTPGHKEPWLNVNVTIGSPEREAIRAYVHSCSVATPGKKAKGLPPGLAKKVAAGGELPPGWQKKCVRGEVLPAVVFKHCHPLPHEILVKLPPPPHGTIMVAIDGKIVRLAKATHEILDVFDLH